MRFPSFLQVHYDLKSEEINVISASFSLSVQKFRFLVFFQTFFLGAKMYLVFLYLIEDIKNVFMSYENMPFLENYLLTVWL